jgi:hypothetical protein
MIGWTQIAKRDSVSIAENLRPFVKQDFYRPLTEYFEREFIADCVYGSNLSAKDGALPARKRRKSRQINR